MTVPASAPRDPAPPSGWARTTQEARAARAWWSARREARSHRRAGARASKALDEATAALGRGAVDRPSLAAVAGRDEAAAACAARAAAEAAAVRATAQERLAADALERFDRDARARRDAAARTLDAARAALRGREKAGAPPAEVAAAGATVAAAETAQAAERGRIDAERTPLESAARDAARAARDAVAARDAASTREREAVVAFGRAVAAASPADAATAPALAAVRAASAAGTEHAGGAQAAQERAASLAPDARRFAFKAGGALGALALLVVGVVALAHGSGGAPGPAPSGTTARAEDPVGDGRDRTPLGGAGATSVRLPATDGEVGPAGAVPASVRTAVLALGSVAAGTDERGATQRPLGDVVLDGARPGPDRTTRLSLHVDVERKAAADLPATRVRVAVEAVVGPRGALVQLREVGEGDLEFLGLFD